MILVDAGPLVALLHRRDRNHEMCVEVLKSLTEPLGTAWPVVTEAMYLLSFSWDAQNALWEMLDERQLALLSLDLGDAARMRGMMRKYADLPMDLADASLVRIAEREGLRRVFTLDRRDFSIYRPARIGRLTVIP